MFKFSNYINPLYFFIAFAIGIFLTYIMNPPQKIVYKYPTPENTGQIIYRDLANNCYKYKATKVKCPSNYIDNIIQDTDEIPHNIKMKIYPK